MASVNRNQRLRVYDLERLTELESKERIQKNNEKSLEFRQQGNTFFAKKKLNEYLKAIAFYNKSICYAKTDTEDLSVGYANRSAVYFELKLYDICLQNIELARNESAYPMRLDEKLQRREAKCHELLASHDTKPSKPLIPELSFPPHDRIPFIADCLELHQNEKYGRHVVATRDIQIGQIIAIEEPFCTTVDVDQQYECCHNCGLENCQSLIPCRNCPHVMFCSARCSEEAQRRYHRYECQAIDYLHATLPDNYSQSTLRIFLCALTSFDSVDKLLHCIENAKQNDQNVFNVDYDATGPRVCHAYEPIYAMQNGPDSAFSNEMIKLLSHIVRYLVYNTDLGELISVDQLNAATEIIKHHHFTTLLNLSAVSRIADASGVQKSLPKSVYAFRSLLNHSCAPNVMTTGYGNKVLLSAVRPIKAGEQIFDNYGYGWRHSFEFMNINFTFSSFTQSLSYQP